MWSTVKEMLKSKKFLAAVLAGVVWIAGRFGAKLNTEELLGAVSPLWAYVIAQGAADFGKAKAAIEAPKT